MAVMVPPTKVEYSVTKGGLRSWIVLIVFFFLCSAMLTIFSDSDDDTGQTIVVSPDDIDNADDNPQETVQVDNTPPDIDDEIEEESADSVEESLFASLREKAASYKAKREETEETQDNEPEETPKQRTPRRRKTPRITEDENNEKIEEVNLQNAHTEEEENVEDLRTQVKARRGKPHLKEPENVEKEAENDEPEMEIEEEAENEDDEDDDVELPPTTKQHRRHKAKSWQKSVQAQRMSEDQKNPRKGLLKHQKRQKKNNVEVEEDEEHADEVNDDELSEQTEPTALPKFETRDVVSIRKKSGHYNRKAITNRDDRRHASKLDLADYLVEKHDFDSALITYDQVISSYRHSPRAHFGRARIFQLKSEFESSEALLDEAIAEYQVVLDNDDTPEELFRQATENFIECTRFRGNLHKVMTAQRALIDKFPEDVGAQNDFGVTFLMMNRPDDAKSVFSAVLESDPNNAVAQAYYGYILKVYDQEIERGVQFMRRGMKGSGETIRDAKFYFHLGDGLTRLGRTQEAYGVYEDAVALGLFPSVYQRSMFNLDGLTARPWWTLEQTGCGKYLRHIERQWTVIREESVEAWEKYSSAFEDDDPHMTEGIRKALFLRKNSVFNDKNCRITPVTCDILKKFAEGSSCDKDEIKISVLLSGSRVWPHCAPSNFVLEAELGLVVPSEARLRVGHDAKGWKTGKFLVFDESFEHEIWFDGAASNSLRVTLSLDLWHPQVPTSSRTES
jgi:aspartate beta-hydroxylase